MSEKQRKSDEFKNLQKPGWLPTSIVVNILDKSDQRNGRLIAEKDLVLVKEKAGCVQLHLPENFSEAWKPEDLFPFEIIDGQHRLWAFDEKTEEDFELPVVAFWGLDISWQAYLFWTINIKPKKINPSLAFDLYPLLRAQDWLDSFRGPIVYREARAQELVDLLWSNKCSPWYQSINMLGEKGKVGQVSQSAWIRSLIATYIKQWNSPERQLGGFFGVANNDDNTVIPWSRMQQAAFIIFIGKKLKDAIANNKSAKWINEISQGNLSGISNPGFESPTSLLTTDQGIRGLLDVTNMILCALYQEIRIDCFAWVESFLPDEMDRDVSAQLESLETSNFIFTEIISDLSHDLAKYDWRSYTANFSQDEKIEKDRRAAFRGSGGYKMIRSDLLVFLRKNTQNFNVKTALDRIENYISI